MRAIPDTVPTIKQKHEWFITSEKFVFLLADSLVIYIILYEKFVFLKRSHTSKLHENAIFG